MRLQKSLWALREPWVITTFAQNVMPPSCPMREYMLLFNSHLSNEGSGLLSKPNRPVMGENLEIGYSAHCYHSKPACGIWHAFMTGLHTAPNIYRGIPANNDLGKAVKGIHAHLSLLALSAAGDATKP